MKYILIALGILSAFPSFADKKKKSNQKVKPSSTVATPVQNDGTEYVTTPGNVNEKQASGHLPATQVGASLIHFTVHEWNGKEYNRDMVGKGPFILMLYNPGCDHCLEMCKHLLDNLNNMPETELLLISGVDTKPAVNDFMAQAGIQENDPRIHVTLADRDVTDQIFEAKGIPQLMIYNAAKILQKVFYSETDIAEVTTLLKK